MSTASSPPTRRGLYAIAATAACGIVLLAAAGGVPKETLMTTTMTQLDAAQQTASDAIRPFHVNVPDAALADLRRRLQRTRWPDKETVADPSRGAQLANLQELVWGAGIVEAMGRQAATGLLGIHTNLPASQRSSITPLNAGPACGECPPKVLYRIYQHQRLIDSRRTSAYPDLVVHLRSKKEMVMSPSTRAELLLVPAQ